jgi:hypothetical protein
VTLDISCTWQLHTGQEGLQLHRAVVPCVTHCDSLLGCTSPTQSHCIHNLFRAAATRTSTAARLPSWLKRLQSMSMRFDLGLTKVPSNLKLSSQRYDQNCVAVSLAAQAYDKYGTWTTKKAEEKNRSRQESLSHRHPYA